MKTLRQIYDELVEQHAPGASGEIVTTFSDKGRMHSATLNTMSSGLNPDAMTQCSCWR
jgi:hypothetical protein